LDFPAAEPPERRRRAAKEERQNEREAEGCQIGREHTGKAFSLIISAFNGFPKVRAHGTMRRTEG
jgi:hypothetical protein